MTGSWIEAKRLVSAVPGPLDSFVVTLADGKRIDVTTADRYDEVLVRATTLASRTKLAVKVLPMTAAEFFAFAGVELKGVFATPDAEASLRRQAIETLRAAMIEAADQSTRVEARDLLRSMGELR